MTDCLVIIDMQWVFLKSLNNVNKINKLINNICKKIEFFKKKNLPIVIVEYVIDDCLTQDKISTLYTAKKILNSVSDYENLFYATKINDSGSKEIIDALNGKKYFYEHDVSYQNNLYRNIKRCLLEKDTNFFITGVNASACVLDTAIDLYKMGYKVFIPMFCSCDTFTNEWVYEIELFYESEIKNAISLVI